jgi:glycosyltransferase involved in cell wall biosynthesis
MKPKVSVIIPVYNCEKFIRKCCNSLFNQTLNELELIFVDDCSPDDSVNIIIDELEKFPLRKPLVKIINHTINLGVTEARKTGIRNATGSFLIHCDSDDWVDENMYECMYEQTIKNNAQLVICGYISEFDNKSITGYYPVNEEKNTFLRLDLSPIYGSLCNKLASIDLIFENRVDFFENINMGEDLGYATQLRLFSNKTIVLNEVFYHYNIQNTQSIFTTFNLQKNNNIIDCVKKIDELFKGKIISIEQQFQLEYLKFQSKQYLLINKNIRNLNRWRKIYPETHQYILQFKHYPLNLRIISWLISKNLTIVARFLLYVKDFKTNFF